MATGTSPAQGQHLEASLVAEPSAIAAGKPFSVGLHLKLEPHWHVYWINPGDAGLPVTLAWQLPQGFTAGAMQWPYPQKIAVPPLMNFGYEGEVLLPVEITPPGKLPAGGKIEIKAKAKWIVCKDICLPGSAELALSLPVATGTQVTGELPKDPAQADLFKTARTALPLTASPWKFSALLFDSSVVLIATPATAPAGASLASMSFFPREADFLENAQPQRFYPVEGGFALEMNRVPPDPEDAATKGSNAKIGPDSLIGVNVSESGWNSPGGQKAVEIRVPLERGKPMPKALAAPILVTGQSASQLPPPGPRIIAPRTAGMTGNPEPVQGGAVKLLLMLSLAFVGGLILNLMPCVLPVLSLKIFDFVKRAGESRWKIFSHGLTFTAGVLVSFWVLAGLLLILRSGGQQLGWGFQLQSPAFLIVLCALFFFFSLNLFGVFELGYMFTRIGGTGTQSGHAGSFFAGVTATVVATPCTAPFMGSAMGYAFSQPAYYAMLVFTFLGLGMAAPYLLLSGYPGLMRFLPKPGEWMEHLKQFMGFPLLATAIWLAWVLGHQAGVDALVALLFILLLAGISAWILGKWTALHRTTPVRVVAGLIALVVFFPAFILVIIYLDQIRSVHPASTVGGGATLAVPEGGIAWEPFSEEKLAALTSQGKPVFVDFTADWCLSCKVNERVAFGSTEVTQKFRELGLAVLKADWTLRDEAISRALSKYGRNSIPLYVLYLGSGPNDYVLLPEVLSPGILLDALKRVPPPLTTMRGN